jgi:DinB superfamily
MEPHLERLQNDIALVTRDLTAADLVRHAAGKWSAAEVLEHLYLTYTGTVKGFERCLQAGRPLATAPTLKQRIASAVTVGAGFMPGKREAPPFTRPKGLPADKIIAEMGAQIAAMDAIISQCEERFGKRVKLMNHHVLGPLTGAQWRKFHWVHGRHHIKQIARLRAFL